ncbi:NAD(P)-dependent oxidoreductase [Methylophaga sulfidovorans]|uniref:NAD(P)-binding domain-containing protein n=1 Tax=Methylophaga sulfidovorans TaxID=45496 RepID=A0A1I4BCJ3_9GAMM|nr:NAD(P)-dependent oxidoreductase [Methylophaga sulfidovorans]SFK65779.1 hypothetical protein SAMN04488079_11831 [Methylophaga sulfidovorans]
MSHIAVIGASGEVGSRIVKELSDRHHQITAISRHPENIPSLPGVTALKADLYNTDEIVQLLKGHDAVVSAVKFVDADAQQIIDVVKQSGVQRYLVVGGAGSLEVQPGLLLIDTPEFPEVFKTEATKGAEFLDEIQKETNLNWTFLSPSALLGPGERTGKFRLGKDTLLTTGSGSHISYEDYAVALVDEIENPQHPRQRFTVGY